MSMALEGMAPPKQDVGHLLHFVWLLTISLATWGGQLPPLFGMLHTSYFGLEDANHECLVAYMSLQW
jgi:hypothetical protein